MPGPQAGADPRLLLQRRFAGTKGDSDIDLERRLTGHGRGRAVLTASRAGEHSYEGDVRM